MRASFSEEHFFMLSNIPMIYKINLALIMLSGIFSMKSGRELIDELLALDNDNPKFKLGNYTRLPLKDNFYSVAMSDSTSNTDITYSVGVGLIKSIDKVSREVAETFALIMDSIGRWKMNKSGFKAEPRDLGIDFDKIPKNKRPADSYCGSFQGGSSEVVELEEPESVLGLVLQNPIDFFRCKNFKKKFFNEIALNMKTRPNPPSAAQSDVPMTLDTDILEEHRFKDQYFRSFIASLFAQ